MTYTHQPLPRLEDNQGTSDIYSRRREREMGRLKAMAAIVCGLPRSLARGVTSSFGKCDKLLPINRPQEIDYS
jgi:hypothetical protein